MFLKPKRKAVLFKDNKSAYEKDRWFSSRKGIGKNRNLNHVNLGDKRNIFFSANYAFWFKFSNEL